MCSGGDGDAMVVRGGGVGRAGGQQGSRSSWLVRGGGVACRLFMFTVFIFMINTLLITN